MLNNIRYKILALFPILFILSCAKTYDPLTGKKVYTLLPPEKEIQLGKMYVPLAINQNNGQYPDKEVREYISKVGFRIAKVVPRKLPYRFFIVNSEVVNAFALPGGPVFVNRGLLLVLNNESELAGVLGHELGHINARHHARFLEKQYGIAILLNILNIALAGKDYGTLLMDISKIGAQLLTLHYSREQESEADVLGVRFSYEAGYDPRGLLETFYIFKKLGKPNAPEWLLTHPLPDTRIKNVKKLLSKYDLNKPLIKDSPEFHRIKNKILKTKPSYELLKKAIRVYNQKDLKNALRYLNQSIQIFPINNASLTVRAIIYTDLKEYRKSIKDAEKAVQIDDLYFMPQLILGYDYLKIKNFLKSIKILENAKKLIPSFPDTYYFLGLDYEAVKEYKKAIQNYKTALQLTDGKRGWEQDAERRLIRLQRLLGY